MASRLRLLLVAILATVSVSVANAAEQPVNVVEFIDFTCPHCLKVSPNNDEIAALVKKTGGVFRVAPVGPVISGQPGRSIIVYYALLDVTHNNDVIARQAEYALFKGFANGAMLDSDDGVISWLSNYLGAFKIDWAAVQKDIPNAEHRFYKAYRMARANKVTSLPTFVVMNGMNGATDGVARWKGSAIEVVNHVEDLIQHKKQKTEQPQEAN